MGTSASYRAPARPRWQAFVTALTRGASVDRVRSELFNAGADEWQSEISAIAVATFAEAVARLYDEMPGRLAQSARADVALAEIVAEVRHASGQAGFSAASAIAERAFARLLLATTRGATDDAASVGARWTASRGEAPVELVARYVGEVLGQYARHVTDREAGTLVAGHIGSADSARLTEALAVRAASIGTSAASEALQGVADVSSAWALVVARAFEAGRELPGPSS